MERYKNSSILQYIVKGKMKVGKRLSAVIFLSTDKERNVSVKIKFQNRKIISDIQRTSNFWGRVICLHIFSHIYQVCLSWKTINILIQPYFECLRV